MHEISLMKNKEKNEANLLCFCSSRTSGGIQCSLFPFVNVQEPSASHTILEATKDWLEVYQPGESPFSLFSEGNWHESGPSPIPRTESSKVPGRSSGMWLVWSWSVYSPFKCWLDFLTVLSAPWCLLPFICCSALSNQKTLLADQRLSDSVGFPPSMAQQHLPHRRSSTSWSPHPLLTGPCHSFLLCGCTSLSPSSVHYFSRLYSLCLP